MNLVLNVLVFVVAATPLWCSSLIIGISGGSGSGKTTFSQKLQDGLGEDSCVILHQDNYYKSLSDLPQPANFDHPDSVDFDLLSQHLVLLKNGCSIKQPFFDFITHERSFSEETIYPRNIIILEGFLIFSIPKIRDFIDLKIFLDVDEDILLLRQVERDVQERGKSFSEIKSDYINYVKPGYSKYVIQAKKFADLVVPNEKANEQAESVILKYLKNDLRN
ncbi:MAG: udk [Parachlamydiales bacterium]|nr:udk [Parachlamydiales bacterium]